MELEDLLLEKGVQISRLIVSVLGTDIYFELNDHKVMLSPSDTVALSVITMKALKNIIKEAKKDITDRLLDEIEKQADALSKNLIKLHEILEEKW